MFWLPSPRPATTVFRIILRLHLPARASATSYDTVGLGEWRIRLGLAELHSRIVKTRVFWADTINLHELCCSSADVQYIFLVGGLSESPLLQQATREKFALRAQVLVPQEASLAVLKGRPHNNSIIVIKA